MCNEHGHGHGHGGATRKAESSLVRALAPAVVVGVLIASVVLRWWPAAARVLPYAPSPWAVLALLLVILLARTFSGVPGAMSPAERHRRAAEFADTDASHRLLQPATASRMAEHLAAAIRFKTVSHDSNPEATAAARPQFLGLHDYLRRTYPLVHRHLERHVVNDLSLVYVWKGSDDATELPYLVTAHLDVVPTPEVKRWTVDPFAGTIKDGAVWGRGAIDLKNLVVGWMEALEDLLKQGYRPRRSLYLALGHDEEIGGWQGAKNISAWLEDRLGRNAFEFMWDEGLFVIDRIVPGHRGPVAMICVAEKGSVTFELSVEGTPGHSSAPPPETAVGILANAVSKLERRPLPSTIDGPAFNMFSALRGGFPLGMRLLMSNLWLFGGVLRRVLSAKHKTATMVRTTTALTVFHAGNKHNVIPGTATAIVQHRVHPQDTAESVEAYDRRVVNDARVQFRRVGHVPVSPVSSHRHPAYGTLAECVNLIYPQAGVAPALFVANSDSRHYWDLAPQIYRFNPILLDREDTKRFHGIDECIPVANFAQVVLFCRTLVERTDRRSAPRARAAGAR